MKHVEQRGAGRVFGIQNAVAVRRENKSQLVLGVTSLQQRRLSTPDLDYTPRVPFRILPGPLFLFEDGGGRPVLYANVLCPSCLLMCLCRGRLDLRRAAVGGRVRTASGVTLTPKAAAASSHRLFRSPAHICLCGMTWTPCRSPVCGRYCPTLTCRIS